MLLLIALFFACGEEKPVETVAPALPEEKKEEAPKAEEVPAVEAPLIEAEKVEGTIEEKVEEAVEKTEE